MLKFTEQAAPTKKPASAWRKLRTSKTYPNRWGEGKTHAMRWAKDSMWGNGWYPICTLKWTHSDEPQKGSKTEILARVDCKKCQKVLAPWV